MARLLFFVMPLFLVLSCGENFIGDPSKNKTSAAAGSALPAELHRLWFLSSGQLVYDISGSESFLYYGTEYTVKSIALENDQYRVVTYHSSSAQYFTHFFTDIAASGMSFYRTNGYASQNEAAGATAGTYTNLVPLPGTQISFPSGLVKNWYIGGTLTLTIPNSSEIQYSGTSYAVIVSYQNGSVTKVIAKTASDLYYAFFFQNITSSTVSLNRSDSYISQRGAEGAAAGSYSSCSSQAPSPWTTSTFPSGLIKTWNTTGGTLAYTISGSSSIAYQTTTYTVIAIYKNGTAYKIIVRSPSNLYFAFFFNNITGTGMTSYRSGSYASQSAAEAAAEGTHSTYVAASVTVWTSISFPSAVNQGWYNSSGTLNYLFYNSFYVYWTATQLYHISSGQNGSTYRIIMKINGSSYYVFFFTNLTATSANIHISTAKSTLSDAEAAVAGTYTAYTAQWPLSSFPTALNGSWQTASNLVNYTITNSTTIVTNGVSYTIASTYKQGTVYKVIATRGSNFHTFYFKDITSTVMYVNQLSGVSTYQAAFTAAQGTYMYHKK